jgi:hypothetical protein
MDINISPIQSNNIENEPTSSLSCSSSFSSNSSSSSISTLTDYENYVIKANVCKMLSRELSLPEMVIDEKDIVEPPTEYGLSNSDVIIPSYYHLDKDPSKILGIDYFNIIKDDIRNYRTLNKYQLEYIKDLTHEYKNELIEIFNECIKVFNELMK